MDFSYAMCEGVCTVPHYGLLLAQMAGVPTAVSRDAGGRRKPLKALAYPSPPRACWSFSQCGKAPRRSEGRACMLQRELSNSHELSMLHPTPLSVDERRIPVPSSHEARGVGCSGAGEGAGDT